ncbi:HDOD domain-containing protein [Rubrivivax sp. A210]|uniref:HDOD domain-containing protein n=1 Tax=Rubrivivax sp. A210 TaxID=2772301 RepID=UPI00191A2A92|nr:HDOD domain-containing protein [Rubrivivax sp. A210]CAD5372475.1 HDOD domain-containing protein [Rubrivivax sp. A210]
MNAPGSAHDIEALAARLPAFPRVVLRLLDLVRDEQASFEVMARLIRNDPVLSGNILGLANHIRRLHAQEDLTDPFHAASLIGINHMRRIIVSVGMNRFIGGGKGSEFFYHHSFAVAVTSQELALLSDVSPDEAYVAGILHDVGQLCFHLLDERAFQEAYEKSIADGRLLEREAEIFGLDHCQIGEQLAAYWNLPADVLSAIRTHHDDACTTSRLQAAVCLGETLARALDVPPSPRNRVMRLNSDAVELLGLRWDAPEMLDCFGRCRARYRHGMA